MFNFSDSKLEKGLTLIEALVSVLLVSIIFLGIIGAFGLNMKVLSQSKARSNALALANQRLEEIRNLPYNDVGTIGGVPSGQIPQAEEKTINGIKFTRRTTIIYIDDVFDRVLPQDLVPTDYKRARVSVSWENMIGKSVVMISDVSPKGVETTVGGGTLAITVLNASGIGVNQANIRIINGSVNPAIDASYQTDDYGTFMLVGAPASQESYNIIVTKTGYSQDKTYNVQEVANPQKPYISVYEGNLTEIGFAIDEVSNLTVETRAQESFYDEFHGFSKSSSYQDVEIESGQLRLKKITEYFPSGHFISETVAPPNLSNWDSLVFKNIQGEETIIKYQILAYIDESWSLIPDQDLPNNSSGFQISPLDLSGLDVGKYPSLRAKANLSTTNLNITPYLDEWYLHFNTPKLSGIEIRIRGNKIIGTDSQGQPVYKYTALAQSGGDGKIILQQAEWDSYLISSTPNTGMDLIRVYPSNPIDVLPKSNVLARAYFKVQNSLLVNVLDASTLQPIVGVDVRLYNGELGYDRIIPTDLNGKSFFLPLQSASYNLEATRPGYQPSSKVITISGAKTTTFNLQPE